MTLNDLTVNFKHLERESILSDWVWLIGKSRLPILLSASGDAFLQDLISGEITCLDTAAGELFKVAEDIDEFQQLLSDTKFVVNHFAVEMVGDLIKNSVTLKSGEIYSFKKPPALGGDYVLTNIEPTDIEVHFSISGQIHEQIKDLPEGTRINNVYVD
jgi:hypothetical protein